MPTLTLKIISTQHEEKLSFETASRNNRDIWKICERSFATRMILCTVKVSTSIIDFPKSILLYRYLLPSYFQYGNS